MKSLLQTDTRIPRRPLLWLAAGLLFTLPPMFGALARWVPTVFLIALAVKFWMEPRGYRLRSVVWKLSLATIMLIAVFQTYGSARGIEPGISLIVTLMSIKILEAHTGREFLVMIMVAWVLCLCGFFLSQDLAIALCLLVAFALLLIGLVDFHRGSSPAFWASVRTASGLLLQAVPLVLLFFLLFPRITTGLRFQLGRSGEATTGFSSRLSPGSVASLASSTGVAFRAEFPNGEIPPLGTLYWRGVVMSEGYGLEWKAPVTPATMPRSRRLAAKGHGIRQRITIEAHNDHWMFALDLPVNTPSGATIAPGNYLWSAQTIRKPRQYEVTSFSEQEPQQLPERERDLLIDTPAGISPAARDLAQSWTAASKDPQAIITKALQFFRSQGFRYSLSPGEYKNNDFDEFLFRRRIGFCEHYAASFATLMRLAGLPARVVTGYLGGEYNHLGDFILVRQADAHAWCEVWLPQVGWKRVDPTSVVAPDRVELGFDSFLERRVAMGQMQDRQGLVARRLARSPLFAKWRLFWQTLNYSWDTHVLSFDAAMQKSLLGSIGWRSEGPLSLILVVLISAGGVLSVYLGWTRWRTRPPANRVKQLYENFCRKVASLGASRQPWEGPLDFSNRAMGLLPDHSARIRNVTNIYVGLRYSPWVDSSRIHEMAREIREFGRS